MDDYDAKQKLIVLSGKIHQQTFWGLVPEMPEWEFNELGAYLLTISLPVFINNLTVKNGFMSFAVTSFEQFTKHTEVYEINVTIEQFTVKLQAVINSQTEQDFCQHLLGILGIEVCFVKEWDD
jgi:hypothetical protein